MLADHADLDGYWRLTKMAIHLIYLIDLLIKHSSTKNAAQLAEWEPELEKVSDKLESLPEELHTEVNRACRRRWGTAYLFSGKSYASAPDAVKWTPLSRQKTGDPSLHLVWPS
jgi:hypothetical protein